MPFKKGNAGKPQGAVNKSSQKIREFIAQFIEDNLVDIQMNYDSLKPVERMKFISDILPYAAPKLQSTSMDITGEIDYTMTFGDDGAERKPS